MCINTRGRYAVNALLDLALRDAGGPVTLVSISQRQRIALSTLEQLFSRLRRDGLVESTRGPGGGYKLGRGTDEISVADIVAAVDDAEHESDADAGTPRISRALWHRLDSAMREHMAAISLASLVQQQLDKGVRVEPRPVRRPVAPPPTMRPVRTNAPNSVFAFGQSFASAAASKVAITRATAPA